LPGTSADRAALQAAIMRQLHYYPSTASMAPHIVLHEIGAPFDLVLVDRTQDAHRAPDYLRLNPNGTIPVYTEDGLVLYESAAICLHLADTHPQAALMPPLGSAQRAHATKWLLWLTNTLQPALMIYFYPERWSDAGDARGAERLKWHAQQRVGPLLDQLDQTLATHGGPWLLGTAYSVVDPFCLMLCRWTRGFGERPARERAHLGPYLQRMLQRPAVQRAFAAEGLVQPWV
jgi:glutathione S-transferase